MEKKEDLVKKSQKRKLSKIDIILIIFKFLYKKLLTIRVTRAIILNVRRKYQWGSENLKKSLNKMVGT